MDKETEAMKATDNVQIEKTSSVEATRDDNESVHDSKLLLRIDLW